MQATKYKKFFSEMEQNTLKKHTLINLGRVLVALKKQL